MQYYKTIIFCTFLNSGGSFLGNSTLFSTESDTLQFTINQYFPFRAFSSPLYGAGGTQPHLYRSRLFSSHVVLVHTTGQAGKEGTGIFILPTGLSQR